jgi:Ca-activated chloride channel family protein
METLNSLTLSEPGWASLLFLLPLAAWLVNRKKTIRPAILFPTISLTEDVLRHRMYSKWLWFPNLLRYLSLSLLVLALCRPQIDRSTRSILSSGVDVILAVDLSGSMLALDMSESKGSEVTRLDVVKEVLEDFIQKRLHDRIGLVAFAEQSYLVSALTLDKDHLLRNLLRMRVGLTEKTGTNIGSALAEGINRLRPLESKSKVIILLTDGKDEPTPTISPLTLSNGAQKDGIKVHTISIGSSNITRTYTLDPETRDIRKEGGHPVIRNAEYPVDEKILAKIAQSTGGKFFRARDEASLRSIYEEIDRLEKSDVEMQINALFEDIYIWPLGFASVLLILEFLLSRTFFLRIP